MLVSDDFDNSCCCITLLRASVTAACRGTEDPWGGKPFGLWRNFTGKKFPHVSNIFLTIFFQGRMLRRQDSMWHSKCLVSGVSSPRRKKPEDWKEFLGHRSPSGSPLYRCFILLPSSLYLLVSVCLTFLWTRLQCVFPNSLFYCSLSPVHRDASSRYTRPECGGAGLGGHSTVPRL